MDALSPAVGGAQRTARARRRRCSVLWVSGKRPRLPSERRSNWKRRLKSMRYDVCYVLVVVVALRNDPFQENLNSIFAAELTSNKAAWSIRGTGLAASCLALHPCSLFGKPSSASLILWVWEPNRAAQPVYPPSLCTVHGLLSSRGEEVSLAIFLGPTARERERRRPEEFSFKHVHTLLLLLYKHVLTIRILRTSHQSCNIRSGTDSYTTLLV